MSKLLLQKILTGKIEPVKPPKDDSRSPKNPFLQAANGIAGNMYRDQGVNQPLRHPMFVGYRDNKPIYAGSRLFVLY